jgi:hypothetical protein
LLKVSLTYDRGTIIIKGLAHIPFAIVDPRTNSLRAQAMQYSNIINYLHESDIECSGDYVLDLVPSPDLKATNLSLRDYQQEALDRWTKVGMKGCIVLPTGAGKTIIGLNKLLAKLRLTFISRAYSVILKAKSNFWHPLEGYF